MRTLKAALLVIAGAFVLWLEALTGTHLAPART